MSLLFSPEEVFLAVDFVALREAFVVEVRLTVGALETLRVPAPLQNLQDEPVQDGFVAAGTLGDGRCGRGRINFYLKSNKIVNMTLSRVRYYTDLMYYNVYNEEERKGNIAFIIQYGRKRGGNI